MLRFRAEKLNQARVYPLGALTRNLAGETLTEMLSWTEAAVSLSARLKYRWPTRR